MLKLQIIYWVVVCKGNNRHTSKDVFEIRI